MKVFISYGNAADQVTALRLQALGAQKLNEAEVVLGVVGARLTEACRQELNTGLALRKNMIVMSDVVFAPQLQPYFGSNLVIIDPQDPEGAEIGIVQHLKTLDAQQSAKKTLSALGTPALGLLIFTTADRSRFRSNR